MSTHFSYLNGTLFAENVSLPEIANQFGTPTYVYSRSALIDNYQAYEQACAEHAPQENPALICFSVKSCSNLAVLNLLARQGSGFDIVSGGELERVIAAGGDPKKTLFSGVGKTAEEIRLALKHDILCFNVESAAELNRINSVAGEMGKKAPVSLRVNPDINPKTHKYISTGLKENKFGIPFPNVLQTYRAVCTMPNIEVLGVDCHIGSQIMEAAPLLEAVDKLIELVDRLAVEGIPIRHFDIGGGLGVAYQMEKPVQISDFVARVYEKINAWRQSKHDGKPIKVIFEPGRSIAANAGLLLTEVQYLKPSPTRNFAVVDAGMNDLMRPAMYDAWHRVQAVSQKNGDEKRWHIVGPICESGDWLAKDRKLAVEQGDLLAVMTAGAYGMTMASNYNSRGKPAEVMVDGDKIHLIRKRENIADLFAGESILP